MKFKHNIPGFRSGKRWKMALVLLSYLFIISIISAAVITSSYNNNSPVLTTIKPSGEPSGKALVVYYSLGSKMANGSYLNCFDGGYSEQVAYSIARGLVSKNFEVTLLRVEPTSGNVIHMLQSCGKHDINIKPVNFDVSGYDLIVIGSPTWNEGPVSAIKSYINQASNLKGKKVALFITAEWFSSLESTENKIRERGANVTDTLILVNGQKTEANKLAEEFGEKLGS